MRETEAKPGDPGLTTRTLGSVDPKPVSWLWPNVIARGRVTSLMGNPGLGKSIIAMDIAARTSAGLGWPGGGDLAQPEVGSVLLLNAEDDPADTIRPRLEAAGADLSRVHLLSTALSLDAPGEQSERSFSLACDLPKLADEIERIGDCRLLIVDPIGAYLGGMNPHNNADVLGLLNSLSGLAARFDLAVFCISHTNRIRRKTPDIYCPSNLIIMGSSSRAWLLQEHGEDKSRRALCGVPDEAVGYAEIGVRIGTRKTDLGAVPVIEWDAAPEAAGGA